MKFPKNYHQCHLKGGPMQVHWIPFQFLQCRILQTATEFFQNSLKNSDRKIIIIWNLHRKSLVLFARVSWPSLRSLNNLSSLFWISCYSGYVYLWRHQSVNEKNKNRKPRTFTFVPLHRGYFYYIDGYKKWNRSSQPTMIDIKTTAPKNAIELHWSHTSE